MRVLLIILFTVVFNNIKSQPPPWELATQNFGTPDSSKIEMNSCDSNLINFYSICYGDTLDFLLPKDSIFKYKIDTLIYKVNDVYFGHTNILRNYNQTYIFNIIDTSNNRLHFSIIDTLPLTTNLFSISYGFNWLVWNRFSRTWERECRYREYFFRIKCCEGKNLPFKISALDSSLCYGESTSLIANTLYPRLRWSNADTTASIIVSEPGLYYCIGSNVCGSDTQFVRVGRDCSCLDSFALPDRVAICPQKSVDISPLHTSPHLRYLWSTGDTTASISVRQAGSYVCTAYNHCFSFIDTSVVYEALESRSVQQEFEVQYPDAVSLDACFIADRYEWVDAPDGCITCPSVRFVPNRRLLRYTLRSFSDAGCKDSCVYIIRTFGIWGSVYVPNAFSPNGDNNNDDFEVFTNNATLHKTTIYNRWGEKVFFSTDQHPKWDGSYKGSPAPAGVYVCEVVYTEADKETTEVIKSSVSVVR